MLTKRVEDVTLGDTILYPIKITQIINEGNGVFLMDEENRVGVLLPERSTVETTNIAPSGQLLSIAYVD